MPGFYRSGPVRALWLGALMLAAGVAVTAAGQDKAADRKPAEKKPPPPAQEISLTAQDGLELQATYFGSLKGRDGVPVILLHMYKGSRADYKELAPYLQSQGHAVLVPDLRGHGGSTKFKGGGRPLDAAAMPPDQFMAMVTYDMETLKAFLIARNNAGELNIEKLCVVGAEMGAAVALDFARADWSWPPLVGRKQGQDVKALVLISPEWAMKGLSLKAAMGHRDVLTQLSILILVGKQKSTALAEAQRLNSSFERYHRTPKDPAEKDLFYVKLDTSLQGTKLLSVKGLKVDPLINEFIGLRLVKQNYPWRDRTQTP